ncbi:family 16 glycoside hydrolase [Planctomycetota bacterium]
MPTSRTPGSPGVPCPNSTPGSKPPGPTSTPGRFTSDEDAIQKLNGVVTNVITDIDLQEGAIALQAETAEIYYRNIRIKEFDESIPAGVFLNTP